MLIETCQISFLYIETDRLIIHVLEYFQLFRLAYFEHFKTKLQI